MEEKQFVYRYSAEQKKDVEAIRTKYLPSPKNKFEQLKKLDRRVQNAGVIQSLSLGIVGVLLFGIGMCFGLGVFGDARLYGLPFGIVGILVMSPAYPLHRYMVRKTKEKWVPEIIRLADELMQA